MMERPTLRLRLRNRPRPPRTEFEELVEQAVSITRRVTELESAAAHRLSAAALLRELFKAGVTSPKSVDRLRRKLDSPHMANAQATLRRLVTALGMGAWSSGISLNRLATLSTSTTENELARVDATLAELFAIAIEQAAGKHPDAFGTCESPAAIRKEFDEIRYEQQELFARIGNTFKPTDLEEGLLDDRGFPVTGVRFREVVVPLAPRESVGQRLVAAYIAKESKPAT